MAERIKLGLSRNRLFEFNSTVVFVGRLKAPLDTDAAQKAFKMLSFKVPVIASDIELCSDNSAYIVTESVESVICFSKHSAEELLSDYEKNPLRFCDKLFEFTVSDDNCLVIAGHTVFCDARSLLRMAMYFFGFYSKSQLSVEAEEIYTFSLPKSLPVDVISPLVNKLSSELDDGWQKGKRSFSVSDYESARKKYLDAGRSIGKIRLNISSEDVNTIRAVCSEDDIDFSSAACFAFYKAIKNNVRVTKKSGKMRISADRRYFHGEGKRYCVGAYNGTVSVHLTPKERRKPLQEQLELFHTDMYRALTSPFRVFSDEVLLSNVQPDFCDSAYMYLAGESRLKASKNLAEAYSCMNEELCEFLYCNLTQRFWNQLKGFESVYVSEPFQPHRSRFNATVIENDKGCVCELRFDSERVTQTQAENIIKEAENYLLSLKK